MSHHKRNYEAQGFEWFWNSTFGVPQQLIYRGLRAAQDPNTDFWSHEGILDMSLIPVVGLFDDDRADVSMQEQVQRTNKVLGTKMDPNSGWAQFGVGMLTDPLSFMGGGLTAIGRGAAAGTKAARTGAMPALLRKAGVDVTELTAGKVKMAPKEFLSKIDEALATPLKGSAMSKALQRRALKKAKKEISRLADKKGKFAIKDVGEVLAKGAESELRLGLYVPFTNWGLSVHKTQSHKYWYQYLGALTSKFGRDANDFTGGVAGLPGRAILSATKPIAGLSWISKSLKNMSGMASGWKTGRETLHRSVSSYSGDDMEGLANTLRVVSGDMAVGLKGRRKSQINRQFTSLLDRGVDARRAFIKVVKAAGGKVSDASKVGVPKDPELLAVEYERYYRAFFGLSDKARVPSAKNITGESLAEAVGQFRTTYRDSLKKFQSSFTERLPTVAGTAQEAAIDAGAKGAFDFGRKMKERWGKVFKMGGSAELLDDSTELLTRFEAQATESVRLMGVQLADALRIDAQELGMKADDLDSFFLGVAQGQPMMEEIGSWLNKVNLSKDGANQASIVIGNFVTRLEKTIGSLSVQARGGRGNSKMEDVMNAVSERFAENITFNRSNKIDYDYVYATDEFIPAKSVMDQIGGSRQNKILIKFGRHEGKPLGTLTKTELGHVIEDIVGNAPRKKVTSHGLNKWWGRYTPEMKAIRGLRSELGLNNMSMLSLLNRAKKTGKVTMARNILTGKSFKLSEDQAKRVIFAARSEFEPILARNPNKLTGPARSQYNAARKIQDARRLGHEKVYDNLKPADAERLAPRVPTKVGAMVDGERVKLNEMGRAVARLRSVTDELKSAKEFKSVGPHLVKEIEGALTTVFTSWDDALRASLGKNTRFMDMARDIQKKSLMSAIQHGTHTISSPIAYAARIFSRNSREMLAARLGDNGMVSILESALPTMGASFARNADNMTVQELNELYRTIKKGTLAERKAGARFLESMDKIAEAEGLPKWGEKYSESLFQSVIGREAQAMNTKANIDYVKAALDAGMSTQATISGKIIGVAYGDKVVKYKKATREAVSGGQRTGKSVAGEQDVTVKATGLVIKGDDGVNRTVPLMYLDNETYTGIILGDRFEDTASALGTRATRGPLDQSDLIVDSVASRKNADELIGQNVVLGEKGIVSGIFDSMQNTWANSSEAWIHYDTVQYAMKKFQTVFSPAFHLNNLASMFSQMLTIGTSPVNQVGGVADALRFLGTNKQGALAYDKFNLHAAAIKGGKVDGFVGGRVMGLDFLDVIRKAGLDEIIKKSPEEILKEFPHLHPEDLMFKSGEQIYSMAELLETWRSTGMFGTFMSEGLRGGSSVTRTTAKLRATATAKPGLRRGKEVASDMMESSEVTARLSGFFGQLRQGKGLVEAAENTKLAMVDYSKLTGIERFGIKRAAAYYTFPRHFLPHAAKFYAKHGDRMSEAANLIKSDLFREERGRLRVDFDAYDKEFSFDATRVLPHLEALKVLETVGENGLGLLEIPGLSDNISTINRREKLRAQTPAPVTWGSLPTSLFMLGTGNEDDSMKEEVIDSFWALRFIFDAADPTAEKSILQNFATKVAPIRATDKEAELAMIQRRLRKLRGQLELAMQSTSDVDEQARFAEELTRLTDSAREQARSIPDR
tara:strand:- start:44 stop:4999 length:4956 start_codon:yes stop_codon:yes gene_type:complete